MLLHEMNYVYEVYRQRSFTKRRPGSYISAQPSLSQMVRKGGSAHRCSPLFDRSTSPIGVTGAGAGRTSAPPNRSLQIEADLSAISRTTRKNVSPAH